MVDAITIVVVTTLLTIAHAQTCPTFTPFVTGPIYAGCTSNSINQNCGQNQWGGFVGANLQTLVATPVPSQVESGSGVLHIDNSVISGGFGFQTQSPTTINLWAGSVELINASLIAPGYQFGGDTYEFAFDVYAIAPVADGFFMSISLWNNLYTPLEDRDTYLAVEYDDTSLHLYTLNDGNGNGKQTVVLAAQQWHHIVQRCVFNNNVTANDDCFLYVNGSLVITFTSWRQYHVANAVQSGGNLAETSEPHNFVEFRLSRDPSFYGKSVTAVKGVQIDNFEQSIYNSTNPSSFYRYSTSFDVADSNVNGCERYPVLNGGTCVLPGGTAIGSNGTRLAQCSTGFGGPSCEFALVC